MINQYYCAIKDLLLIQNEDNGNPLYKVDLMTMRMRKLFTIVNGPPNTIGLSQGD